MIDLWKTTLLVFICLLHKAQSADCEFNSMCDCTSQQNAIHVSCVSIPLYAFPNLPEGNFYQIEITGTKISSIDNGILKGREIKSLILQGNQLQSLGQQVFGAPSNVSSVDISRNLLTMIPFDFINELASLQWINFHGNEVSSIVGDWSKLQDSLEILFLGENDLNSIFVSNVSDHQNFQSLRNLKWINLDENKIYFINQNILPVSLETLSLANNLISEFPLNIMEGHSHLKWLYLKGNHIKFIPQYTFTKLKQLEKLDISQNLLNEFPINPFNNSFLVNEINLAFNDFTIIYPNNFNGLRSRKLIISNNAISNIAQNAFNGIEETLEYLDLSHNNLHCVPDSISNLKSLKYLYLSSNAIADISDTSLKSVCQNMKAISLSRNSFTRIPFEGLKFCKNISYFNMGYNKIYEIYENDFSSWGHNVKSLMLNNNQITSLKNIFSDLHSLEELNLSFNPLRIIGIDTLYQVNTLRNLEIAFSIDQDETFQQHFGVFQNLQWLSIDRNDIQTLDDSSLNNLRNLEYFNLEYNKIKVLTPNLFKSNIHSRLKEIRFSNNQLTGIRTETFSKLKLIEIISLANNKINFIEYNAFEQLPMLKKLILSDNNIDVLNIGSFSNLPLLDNIDLHANKLREFNFLVFSNSTSSVPLNLNLSYNQLSNCVPSTSIVNVSVLDFKYNNFHDVPRCINKIYNLRKLYLDSNIISKLENDVFLNLTSLEYLSLQQNNIVSIERNSFSALKKLQVLDISNNLIEQLTSFHFAQLYSLKILDLQGNRIMTLPKDLFNNTSLEALDLSFNLLSVVPSSSLYSVGKSLRSLALKYNKIERLDVTTFPYLPYLQHLDLSNNKLSILPDNVFTVCSYLQTLHLASNFIRANFKELFHYAQGIKLLNLAYSGMQITPYLPLSQLVHLNLSHNLLQQINKSTFKELVFLKYLDLSYNLFTVVPAYIWPQIPHLKFLDLSNNPIQSLGVDSFPNLQNLQILKINKLNNLNKFNFDGLLDLPVLSTLHIQTFPHIENFKSDFCALLEKLDSLRNLHLLFTEENLTNELHCLKNKHIKYIEIKGEKLRHIDEKAFKTIKTNPYLSFKITNTNIEELPSGLFSHLIAVKYLKIDISNNMLSSLSPEIFYGNSSVWHKLGTTLLSGGLIISGNLFQCGCHLAWLGHWMRRWTRETAQSHNVPVTSALKIYEYAKDATCIYQDQSIPILDLSPEDITCQPSALRNNSQYTHKNHCIFYIYLIWWFYLILRFSFSQCCIKYCNLELKAIK